MRPHPVSAAIATLEFEAQPYSVLQIGAYVGATNNDPLWHIFSSGQIQHGTLVCVEPVAEYFRELTQNYAPFHNVRCLNLAVSNSNGTQPIYRLDTKPQDHGQPEWLEQIASLRPNRLSTLWDACEGTNHHNNPARIFCQQHQHTELVRTATLHTTLQLAGIHPELIVIDAEGAEPDILPQIHFPLRFLAYEHILMDSPPEPPPGFSHIQHHHDTFRFRENDSNFRSAYGIST